MALISDATSCRCGTWIAPSISRELCKYTESVCPSPSGAFGYACWRVVRVNERDHCPKRTMCDLNITRVRRTSPLPPPSLRTSCSSSLHSKLNYLAHLYTVWPRSFTQTERASGPFTSTPAPLCLPAITPPNTFIVPPQRT